MRNNIQSIQFLRFVAATLVVLSHSVLAANLYFKDSVSHVVLYFSNFGAVGVHIFFVISGFIMVYTSFAGEAKAFRSSQFLLRRFCRIYPIYWIYAALYIFVHQILLPSYGISLADTIGSLLLLPGYSSLLIGPGWTLSFEVYFYLCFGSFMTLGLKRGLLSMTLYFLISAAVGFALHSPNAVLHVVTNPLLIEFVAGAWIGFLIASETRISLRVANVLTALSGVIFLAGIVYGYHRLPSPLMWGVPSALLIAGFTLKEANGDVAGLIRKLSFLGDSSYSLYLLHILLIDIFLLIYLLMVPGQIHGYIGICSAVTILCVVVAFFLYEIIERPIVRTLQRLANRLLASKSIKTVT